jgi:fibronectin type 3 domain-containing protein
LVAVPAFADQMAVAASVQQLANGMTSSTTAPATTPEIDLSWEPNLEPRVTGYRVYRRNVDGAAPDAWRRLDVSPVSTAAYRDLTAEAGRRYAYRVTAVDAAGNESAPSSEVEETTPAQQ